jgi:hypothetical protein
VQAEVRLREGDTDIHVVVPVAAVVRAIIFEALDGKVFAGASSIN